MDGIGRMFPGTDVIEPCSCRTEAAMSIEIAKQCCKTTLTDVL